MDKQIIKSIIIEKQIAIPNYKLVHRDFLFGDKSNYILVGIRRAGKSYLLYQDIQTRLNKGEQSAQDILYINFEDERLSSLKAEELGTILDSYMELYPGKQPFVYLDEIQNIEGWEKFARRLADSQYRVMITGSNAKMLSGELATRLRGRYIAYRIRGLCYEEFLTFHELKDDDASLNLYLQYGGLPQLRSLGLENTDLVEDYLDNVYNTIVLRDIIERENIRNIPLLRTLLKFVSDNIGKQFSATSIVKFLKSQNTETSAKMILTYLEYLSNAFIIDRVNRYDIHGKRLFELGDKFYFEDLGIRNHIIGGNRRFDIEKVMENAVYIHLCRMGYKVYVGQMYKAEIDFVAEKADSVAYVQVTYLLASEETVEREFGNLKLIKDSHPKYVISMDRLYSQTNIDGIKHIHLRDFLKMTTLV